MLFAFVQDVVCDAARELVDSIGAHDPLTSSQYLALYQVSKLLWGAVLGSWRLDTSLADFNCSEKFLYMISRVLRAVSCYVDKVIRK